MQLLSSNTKKAKNLKTIEYYRCILAVITVGLFFTAADNYLFDSGYAPPPSAMTALLGFASLPLIPSFLSGNYKSFPVNILKWCLFYIIFSALSYSLVLPNDALLQEWRDRVLAVTFLLIISLIFSGEGAVLKISRWAILCTTFWNIYTYLAELFNPGIWNTLTTINETGRPAGFYLDANKAAAVLINAFIFTVGLLPSKYRLPFSLLTLVGVFLTLSRGGIICMVVIIIFMCFKGTIPKHQLLHVVTLFLIIIVNIATFGNFIENEASQLGIINPEIQTRIATFTDPSSRAASDDTSRLDIVDYSWKTFLKEPLVGHGMGYVKVWDGITLPHNMYLSYMVEHGILGLVILPSLVLSIQLNARGEAKSLGTFFGIFTLIWAIFSNTILYDREVLIAYALMATMSKKSSLKNNNSSLKFR
jgi:O-Antigen ligase